ncbi:MAG: vanadium-dependent haloperoxidase [Hyphomicrobiaceae bacterium]
MSVFDRRNVLALGLGAAGSLVAAKGTAQDRSQRPLNLNMFERDIAIRGEQRQHANPISFWNDTSLQLVALDHSIDAKDARAPGPCATARALGLVHAVMADAVAAVYQVDYESLYVKGRVPRRLFPDVFVGGAAAWILEYIYSTPAHVQFIGSQRLRFLNAYERESLTDWNAGLSFARNEAFTSRWNWTAVRTAAIAAPTPYIPAPRRHTVDPYNADQSFYGVNWSKIPTLMPSLGNLAALGPGDPPKENEREYIRDLEEVRELGAYHPEGPTREQQQIGIFWAYDGPRLIGTPPRLYNQFVRQIAESDRMSVPEMARLLALCNIAMCDAGTVCWEAKYRYNVWRPVMGIPHAHTGAVRNWRPLGAPRTNPTQFALGTDTQLRATAQSFLGAGEANTLPEPASRTLDYKLAAFTPNFPAYPSGHATFGSACFNMLKKVRAERDATRHDPNRLDVFDEFVSDELNGIAIDNFRNEPRPYLPVAYRSIDQMIEDNNRSRVYLGVHWNFDCDRGSESGAKVAEKVYRDAYRRYR